MKSEHPNVLIIGVGNEYRRDDGVGIVIARRLRGQAPAGVSIIEQNREGTALLEAWKGHSAVVLVDAVHSGAPLGTIHRLDVRAGRIFQTLTDRECFQRPSPSPRPHCHAVRMILKVAGTAMHPLSSSGGEGRGEEAVLQTTFGYRQNRASSPQPSPPEEEREKPPATRRPLKLRGSGAGVRGKVPYEFPTFKAHCSTHAFGLAEAIEMARALNQLPPRLILYGIEGNDFSAGAGLSAEVEQAAEAATTMVLGELRVLTRSPARQS